MYSTAKGIFSLARFFGPKFPAIFILFLSHCVSFPRTCSCPWEIVVLLGIMAKCHIFLCVYIFFTQCFSVGKSVDVFALFMCVCVGNPEHTACLRRLLPQYQPPPAEVFPPPSPPHPSYLLLCVCHRSILFTTSPLLPILPLGGATTQNKGEKVAQFPPLESPTLPERYSHPNTLNARTVLLYCLICNGAEVVD